MRFRRDRRGAALQVGAVLLLGFLVIALSLYQATVVPEQNKRVEFRHSQSVQDDMVEVRNALRRAGTSDDVQAVSVRMGTTYPSRVFFVNPPPPGGLLRNGSVRSVTVTNATATEGETADFLDTGANGPYELGTENLSYRPGYNVYRAAPRTAYQTGVLVNEFDRGNDTAVTDQGLIRGNEIYLVAVRGNLSRAQTGAYAVDPESLSTSVDATTVSNESGRVNVTVPTTLTEDRWETLLADEDRVVSVAKRGDRVSILLKNGTYRLRTALVGVGTGARARGPAYLTTVTPEGGADVAVEVRDRFNNPVPNSRVGGNLTVEVNDTDVLEPDSQPIGEDGRATFTYAGETGDVNLTLLDDGSEALDTADNGNGSVVVNVDENDFSDTGSDGNPGLGGDTNYDGGEEDTTVVAREGGRWYNITNVSAIDLTGPRYVPTQGDDKSIKQNERYIKVYFTINENTNDTTRHRYYVGIGDGSGISYKPNSDSWSNNKLYIYEETNDGSTTKLVDGAQIDTNELSKWNDETDPLELLDNGEYNKDIGTELDQVRGDLNDDDPDEIVFTLVRGRTNMTLSETR